MNKISDIIPFNYIFLVSFCVAFFLGCINGVYSLNLMDENVYYMSRNLGLFILSIFFIGLPLFFLLFTIFRNLFILKFICSLPDNCYIEKRDKEYFIQPLETSSMHEKLKIAEDFSNKIKIPKVLKRPSFHKMMGYNNNLIGRFEKLDGKFYLVFDQARYKFNLMSSSVFKDFYSVSW